MIGFNYLEIGGVYFAGIFIGYILGWVHHKNKIEKENSGKWAKIGKDL
jgi:hypothetical protein